MSKKIFFQIISLFLCINTEVYANEQQAPYLLGGFLKEVQRPVSFGTSTPCTSQLTIIPSQDYEVGYIFFQSYLSSGGGCSGFRCSTIVDGSAAPATLQSGHTYVTTNMSNNAVIQAATGPCNDINPIGAQDLKIQLQDVNGIALATICIQGSNTCALSGEVCDSTHCGWATAKSWNPIG